MSILREQVYWEYSDMLSTAYIHIIVKFYPRARLLHVADLIHFVYSTRGCAYVQLESEIKGGKSKLNEVLMVNGVNMKQEIMELT